MVNRPRFLTVLLTTLLTLPCVASTWAQSRPTPPRLVLVLAIDQMRFDYLTRFSPLYEGGLRLLLDRGAVFSNANYRHSPTETGPGHSVILSGAHPSHSGIVANEWYDAHLKKVVNVVDDGTQRPVGGEGRSASPLNSLSFTVGDVLKQTRPQSRVVSVSLKDRSAILMGGRRADAAYWYEVPGGNFISSSFYMADPPAWLTRWNSRRLADRYAGELWTRLLPDEQIYERYAGKDAIEGEWDRKDVVFPHAVRGKPPEPLYYDDLRRTPAADELTLSFALEAMKAHQLGQDAVTDLLAIGFSGTDFIGHTYGADSQEIMDQLLRLDRILGQLFKEIDGSAGLANTLLVLTADHGSLPLVENLQAKGIDARRVSPSVLESAVQQAFEKRFPGATDLIAHFAVDIYWNEEAISRRRLDRADVEETAIAALMSTGFVEKVYTQADLSSTEPTNDPFLPLFRNAFFPPRSPHLSVLVKKYTYVDPRPGGTGHGTPYDYDRHVPIVFFGGGIRPGAYPQGCGPEDIAPTLASLLGLDFPREADARLLTEMLESATSAVPDD
jgi:predicted AlkP superfamily pyrophosphatase or phosphodiesterase